MLTGHLLTELCS